MGLLICLFLFLYLRKLYSRDRVEAKAQTKIFLIGFLIPLSTIILPAISRWSYGMEQGLSLRYSYLGILGLSMMVLPLIKKTKIFFILMCCYVFLNLNLISNYKYFSNYGIKHETYVKQLIEWKCENSKKIAPSYPSTIVPGGGHEFIFNSIKWLEPEVCKEFS